MPWQPAMTPAAPLAHMSSPTSYPPTRTWSPHVPPARRLCVDARSGGTCERLSIALSWLPQLGQRRGDGGDGCQRDVSNVIGMIGTEARLRVHTAAMKVQWCVSPIDVLPTGCQPSPFIAFSLLASISSITLTHRSSRRRTYISSTSNTSSHSPTASQGITSISTTPSRSKTRPRVQPSPCVYCAHSTL
jgi:hypothetical protein